MAMKTQYDYMLEVMPEEVKTALVFGKHWEFKPESAEGADDFPYYCEDCDSFHHCWVTFGYEVTDAYGDAGHWCLYRVTWIVDSDGDWDIADITEVGTPDNEQVEKYYSTEESNKAWRKYFEFVRERGEDPLEECIGGGRREVRWEFFAQIKPEGLVFVSARNEEDDELTMSRSADQLPPHVKEYFFGFGDGPLICGPEDVEDICKPQEGELVRRVHAGVLYGEENIPTPETAEEYRARLVAWATAQLTEKETPNA